MGRDYNKEIIDNNNRQYAYNFDFDVMHPYMIKAFTPFKVEGKALELGCYKGAFTKRLQEIFNDITCVEASTEALNEAVNYVTDEKIQFINARFEDVQLEKQYDNIFLTHVLEHIDERVGLLNKINIEWLTKKGVLFVVCPNAHAASRQIAVKMGIMNSCEAVTEGELKHGHRLTYTLDTLRQDILKSGLEIVHESGIFFKPFANFQWDKLLNTDIVTKEYLDGCYELGKEYPDLCSSIYFICKKASDTKEKKHAQEDQCSKAVNATNGRVF